MQLYIHVPFCRSRCGYCSFYSRALPGGGGGDELLALYLNGLLAEISLWASRLGRLRLETVFFGGGTPSILPLRSLEMILKRLHKEFRLEKGAEISFEGNPESILKLGYAAELASLGVNRLSLGLQSLNEDLLRRLGRPHTRKEALAAYEVARIGGIANINLDLIWGLPGQRLRLWLDELKTVASLKPEHLSCYNLSLEEGSPMRLALERGDFELPGDKEQSAMYAYGSEYLETAGFLHYEISNYARMGFKCRHNLGYWEGRDYLGLGPSAVSTLGNRRWSNPPDLELWLKQTATGQVASEYETLDKSTRVLELIMLRLRTDRGLRLQAYRKLTGRDFIADNKELIHGLHRKGMLRIKNGYLSLTGSGMLVSNSILEYLFSSTREKLAELPPAEGAERESLE
jgi:oxygen-independent coproporphyrinogen-3 oxidase